MVREPENDPDVGEMPGRLCATCGHPEADHVVQDAEAPGVTLRRVVCEACGDEHDFVPDPNDV